jgi:hypothetical protein
LSQLAFPPLVQHFVHALCDARSSANSLSRELQQAREEVAMLRGKYETLYCEIRDCTVQSRNAIKATEASLQSAVGDLEKENAALGDKVKRLEGKVSSHSAALKKSERKAKQQSVLCATTSPPESPTTCHDTSPSPPSPLSSIILPPPSSVSDSTHNSTPPPNDRIPHPLSSPKSVSRGGESSVSAPDPPMAKLSKLKVQPTTTHLLLGDSVMCPVNPFKLFRFLPQPPRTSRCPVSTVRTYPSG